MTSLALVILALIDNSKATSGRCRLIAVLLNLAILYIVFTRSITARHLIARRLIVILYLL